MFTNKNFYSLICYLVFIFVVFLTVSVDSIDTQIHDRYDITQITYDELFDYYYIMYDNILFRNPNLKYDDNLVPSIVNCELFEDCYELDEYELEQYLLENQEK